MRSSSFLSKNHNVSLCVGEAACLCLLTMAQNAMANPTGGSVAAGNAHISNAGSTTTITQTSNKAIINWSDFSINPNETTQFKQPSSKSFTLNRVTGNNSSQIMGSLKANGNIYLLNPNGILFGKTAKVDVGGLVASTSQLSDKDFMSGNLQHFTPSNNPNASIINEGQISIKNAGFAALVSPKVVNSGVIEANLGTVVIASADHFTLDLYGDNLITLDAGQMSSDGSVSNLGRITANGGSVLMTAQAVGEVLRNTISMDGIIEAKSVSNKNGKVVLQGYDNSTIAISGNIDVSGKAKGQIGGLIQASADYIQLLNGSVLDASGYQGGGNIHVGSDVFHNPADNLAVNTLGLPSVLRTAQYVYAAADSHVNADSLNSGNAGNVVIWADKATWFYGNISAAARGLTGNGGRIETSGRYLDTHGINVNASSVSGKAGLWLLDPADITVSQTSATSNGSFDGSNPNTFTPTSTAVVNGSDISSALGSANVIISTGGGVTDNNITFDTTFDGTNPITWSSGNSLTFLATGNITINASAAGSQIINPTNATGISTIYFRSDSNSDGNGTVTYTNGKINNGGAGNTVVDLYYNPVGGFATAPTDFSALVSGGATQTGYYLVHDNVAGSTLANIGASAATLSRNYALSQNTSPNANNGLAAFTAIGVFTGIFTGANYTGTNYTISGLNISGAANSGLFRNVTTGTIDNITLINPTVTGTSNVGAVVGLLSGAGTLSGNWLVTGGTVSGTTDVGGMIGSITAGTVNTTGMQMTGSVSGTNFVGGLIGQMSGNSNFQASGTLSMGTLGTPGTVTGTGATIGGLFGSITSAGAFTPNGGVASTMTNYANVSSPTAHGGSNDFIINLGGIVGNLSYTGSATTSSYDMVNNGSVHDAAINVVRGGGIAGTLSGLISLAGNLSNTGNISLDNAIGGLVGMLTGGATLGGAGKALSNSGSLTSIAKVTNISGVGGIVGNLNGANISADTISNSGTVHSPTGNNGGSEAYYGGIVGWEHASSSINATTSISNSGIIINDPIGGAVMVGGIVGYFDGTSGATFYTPTINSTGIVLTPATNTGVVRGTGGVFGTLQNYTAQGAMNVTVTAHVEGVHTTIVSINGFNVGGFAGNVINSTLSTPAAPLSVNNSGDIVGATYLGGIIGSLTGSTITNATFIYSGNISPTDPTNTGPYGPVYSNAGGIIGLVQNSTIDGTTTMQTTGGSVTNYANVGGLIGQLGTGSIFTPSGILSAAGAVSANNFGIGASNANAGGLFGLIASDITTFAPTHSLSNAASVTLKTGSGIGGIFGNYAQTGVTLAMDMSNSGTVTANFGASVGTGGITGVVTNLTFSGALTNSGSIIGTADVGGLFGSLGAGANITNANQTVIGSPTISGTTNVGGLVGHMLGTGTGANLAVFQPAAGGTVSVSGATISGTSNVGGILGLLGDFSVFQPLGTSISTGSGTAVSGTTSNIGGLFGFIQNNANTTFDLSSGVSLTNAGSVTLNGSGGSNVGGIFGNFAQTLTLSNAFSNSGAVTISTVTSGSSNIGGIAGLLAFGTFTGTLTNSGAISIVRASAGAAITGSNIGGLFGSITGGTLGTVGSGTFLNTGNIDAPASTSNANNTNVGGIAGSVSGGNFFRSFSNAGTVGSLGTFASNTVGGLFGTITGGNFDAGVLMLTSNDPNSKVRGKLNVGGIVGNLASSSALVNVTSTLTNGGLVTTDANIATIGGIFGTVTSGFTIPNALTNSGTVSSVATVFTAASAIGGIMGAPIGLTFTNTLSNDGNVSGVGNVGGLFGALLTANAASDFSNAVFSIRGTISDYTPPSGSVTHSNLGGMIGFLNNASLLPTGTLTSHAILNGTDGTGTSISTNVGGVIGQSTVTITHPLVHDTGSVYGGTNVGGVIGLFNGPGVAVTLSNSANVSGKQFVGGVLGALTAGSMTNTMSYNNGVLSVTTSDLGGLIGHMSGGTVSLGNLSMGASATYNINILNNVTDVGGAIGLLDGGTLSGTFATNALSISNATNVGAIIGKANNYTLNGLINSTALSGNSSVVGGVAGLFTGTTPASSSISGTVKNTAAISGGTTVGGVLGKVLSLNLSTGTLLSDTTAVPSNQISGDQYIGGVIGEAAGSSLTLAMTNMGKLGFNTTGSDLGGAIGHLTGNNTLSLNQITLTSTTFNVAGSSDIGGAVGSIENGTATLNNAFGAASLTIGGATNVGAIMGKANNATLTSAAATITNSTTLSGTSSVMGGIAGIFTGTTNIAAGKTLSNNAAITSTAGQSIVGGVLGKASGVTLSTGTISGTINNNVKGNQYIGGLIGEVAGSSLTLVMNESGTLGFNTTGSDLGGAIGHMTGTSTLALNKFTLSAPTFNVSLSSDIGAVAGLVEGTPTFNGALGLATFTINNATNVGVIMGKANNATLGNITNSTALTGSSNVMGGIAGIFTNTVTISNGSTLANNANVTSTGNIVGSVLGEALDATLSGATMAGSHSVSGNNTVGGVIGAIVDSSVSNLLSYTGGVGTSLSLNASGADLGGVTGHMISNSNATPTSIDLGNVTLTSVNFNVTGKTDIGGVVGLADNTGTGFITFSNTLATNPLTINGATNVGTIIGKLSNTNLVGTFGNSTDLSGTSDNVGSLAGLVNSNATLSEDMINISNVAGHNSVGGIVGEMDGTINRDLGNNGDVSGNQYVGGVIGTYSALATSLSNILIYNTGTLSVTTSGLGGLIGHLTGSSINLADLKVGPGINFNVTGASDIGGGIGLMDGGRISGTFATNDLVINGATNVGAIVGQINSANLSGIVVNSTTLNAATSDQVGGIAGQVSGATLSGTYELSGGVISGHDSTGGLFGVITAAGGNTILSDNTIMVTDTGTSVSGHDNSGGLVGQFGATTFGAGLSFTNNANVNTTGDATGGVAGEMSPSGTLTGAVVTSSGTIAGNTRVGGLFGNAHDVIFADTALSTTDGNVTGTSFNVGGLIGATGDNLAFTGTTSMTLSRSTLNTAYTISGTSNVGGFFGYLSSGNLNLSPASMTMSMTNGASMTVSGHSNVGGFIGDIDAATALAAFNPPSLTNIASVVGVGNNISAIGGIIGNSSLPPSFALTFANALTNDGAITATGDNVAAVGGIVGNWSGGEFDGLLTNANTITVSGNGTQKIGGIAGWVNDTTVFNNMTNSGDVLAVNGAFVGGLIGLAQSSGVSTFTGTLQHTAGNTVSGLFDVGGLFGALINGDASSATLLATGTINGVAGSGNVGGMFGIFDGTSLLPNIVNSQAVVTGVADNAGGIFGRVNASTFSASTAFSYAGSGVAGGSNVGSIAGQVNASTLSGSYTLTTGAISGTDGVGGLFGFITNASTIDTTAVFTTLGGTVTGSSHIGGLVGNLDPGTIYSALNTFVNTAAVSSTAAGIDTIGGLFGDLPSGFTITNSLTNNGNVTDSNANSLGGITASIDNVAFANGVVLTDSTGTVSGGSDVGSLFGKVNNTNLDATYQLISGAQVTGGDTVGGLFGWITGTSTIAGNMNTSAGTGVSGTHIVGGLIGLIDTNVTYAATQSFTNAANVVNTSGDYASGIFGRISMTSGNIGNNLLNQGSVTGNSSNVGVGGIMAVVETGLTFSGDLENQGDINGLGDVGGLFGDFILGTLSDASLLTSGGTIIGTGNNAGGLIGHLHNAATINVTSMTVTNATSLTTVTGGNNVGGLVGLMDSDIASFSVTNRLTNAANVNGGSGAQGVGGIIGTNNFAFIADMTNTGNISSGFGGETGGIIGQLSANVSGDLINEGSVFGNFATGGIVGDVTGATLGGTFTVGVTGNPGITMGSSVNGVGLAYVVGIVQSGADLTATNITVNNNVSFDTTAGGITGVGGIAGGLGLGSDISGFNVSTYVLNTSVNAPGGSGVGSVIGFITGENLTRNLHSLADVTGLVGVGGVIGGAISSFAGANVINSILTNTNNVTALGDQAGGVMGHIDGTTINGTLQSLAGNVSGVNQVGGVIGKVEGGSGFSNIISNTAVLTVSRTTAGTSTISGAGDDVGGVIGYLANDALDFHPASMSVNISGGADIEISGVNNVGGILGHFVDSAATPLIAFNPGNATNHANVTGTGDYVAGLYAKVDPTALVFQNTLTNTGNISGNNFVGGLFASLTNEDVSAAILSSTGTVNGTGTDIGGTFGLLNNTLIPSILNATTVVTGTGTNVGGLIGETQNMNITASLTHTGDVTGSDAVGGLIGFVGNSTTINSTGISSGNITADTEVGGLIGKMDATGGAASIAGTDEFTGTVLANVGVAGGLVGEVENGASINVAFTLNNASISTSGNIAGGVLGAVSTGSTLAGTYVMTGSNTVSGSAAGGFFGESDVDLIGLNLVNNNTLVSGFSDIGGIIGDALGTANINSTLINTTPVNGSTIVGGIIGFINDAQLTGSSTNSGSVTANNRVGGLIGTAFGNALLGGTLTNTGNVTGTTIVGGIVGLVRDNVNLSGTISIHDNILTLNPGGSMLGGFAGRMRDNSDISSTHATLGNTSFSAAGASNIGAVLGNLQDNATLSGVSTFHLPATFSIANATNVGGLIGQILNANVLQDLGSAINVNASTSTSVGGVAGSVFNSTITGSLTASGNVKGNTEVGGLIGLADNDTFAGADNVYFGTVTGNTNIGGFAGTLQDGSSLIHVGMTGTVHGTTNTGGIVGNLSNSTIDQAYNNSNHTVVGVDETGGIAGVIDSSSLIQNVLFGGTLTASGNDMGGIVGFNNGGTVNNALSVGTFTGAANNIGALIGNNAGIITNSFYDTRAYPQSVGTGTVGGIGSKDSAVLAGPTVYTDAGWDFSTTWNTSPGNYPILRFCTTDCTVPLRSDPIPPTPPTPPLPVPTPPPIALADTVGVIQTQIVNAELTSLPTFELDTELAIENLIALRNLMAPYQNNPYITNLLAKLPSCVVADIYLMAGAASNGMVAGQQDPATLHTFAAILSSLAQYYTNYDCKCASGCCSNTRPPVAQKII